MRAIALLALLAISTPQLWAQQAPVVNRATLHAAYAYDAAAVRAGYLAALGEMGMTLRADTAAGLIRAVSDAEGVPTVVTVRIGNADTLDTDVWVMTDYVYRPGSFAFHPMGVYHAASERIAGRPGGGYVFPQAAYPEGAKACGSPVKIEDTDAVEVPDVAGAVAQVQRRLRYPETARQQQVEGRIMMQALVDEKGRISCAVALTGLSNGDLHAAAVEAVRKVRLKPFRYHGAPVPMAVTLPITFRLR